MTKIYRMRGKQRFKRPRLERKKKKRSQTNDLNFHLEILAEEKQINSKFSKQKESKRDQRRNQKSQKNDSSQQKKVNKIINWFFDKNNKIDETVARSLQEKKRNKLLKSRTKEVTSLQILQILKGKSENNIKNFMSTIKHDSLIFLINQCNQSY